MISAEALRTKERSGWSVRRTLAALAVSPASFYRHKRRLASGAVAPTRGSISLYQATAEERVVVEQFASDHPDLRHRAMAWTMVDQDVAYLSASTVYRILLDAGLVERWQPKARGKGKLVPRPLGPNEFWQTDLRYVQVSGKTFYLLVFLDVFSRFIVYHELLRTMDGASVSLGAQSALETLPACLRGKVRIQSDNGSAFISADFARVLREHGTDHHRIWPHTPEQNGHVERVMRTLGEPLCEDEFEAFSEARSAVDEIIHWYNHERLHSAIGYLTPAQVHAGEAEKVQAERRQKLMTARHERKEKNLEIRQISLPICGSTTSLESYPTVNLRLSQFG